MKQLHVWVAPAAVTAALLTLTACGSSSKKTNGGTTSSSSQASNSTVPSSSQASTSAPAAPSTPLSAIVLQASDLPATFKKSAPEPDDPAEQAKVAACVGVKDQSADKVDNAKSSFDQGDNGISSDASRFKSQSDVTADTAMLRSPKIDGCLQQSARRTFTKSLPAGAKIDKFSFHVSPGANGGPSNLAGVGQGTITLSASGQTVQIFITIAFITGPRIEAEVDITGVGAPIAEAVQRQAIKAVADRAAKG
jgi:hypothetical protein